jgi:ribulose-5-phosphate 4-epimerase/fuculose-1-phosphate aldolase
MTNSTILREFLHLCRQVYDKGFVSGSGGNISARIGNNFIITPTGRNIGTLVEKDIVRMSFSGNVLGEGNPSKEWRMHCRCYERDDVAWVVHAHTIYATAVSCLPVDSNCAMPVFTPGYSVRVGKLPVAPYLRPGSEELAEWTGKVIAARNSLLMANHGLITVGGTAEQALNLTEEIESNARLFFILSGRGAAMTEAQQTELAGKY